MRRIRLGTVMLLVGVVALCVALAVQHRRAARREAALQARVAELEARWANSLHFTRAVKYYTNAVIKTAK